MEALAAEAAKQSPGDPAESTDEKVERALACPCIADLKEGPCGRPFVAAFTCFLKSQDPEKGMDCLEAFGAMQQCMVKHPEAFADFVQSKVESDAELDEAAHHARPQ